MAAMSRFPDSDNAMKVYVTRTSVCLSPRARQRTLTPGHVAACLDPVILDLVLLSVEGTDDPRPLTGHEAAAQLD
jgi:hypothetical protein